MKVPLVLTVLGPDRSGIARDLAAVVAAFGGNWGESRLVRLAGQFAGVVQIEVPRGVEDAVVAELQGVPGLQVLVERSDVDEPDEGRRFRIEVVATDRSGIVRDVTAAVADCAGNIERFVTDYVEAPMAGGLLFRARILVRVEERGALAQVPARLHAIADDLQVDISPAGARPF